MEIKKGNVTQVHCIVFSDAQMEHDSRKLSSFFLVILTDPQALRLCRRNQHCVSYCSKNNSDVLS